MWIALRVAAMAVVLAGVTVAGARAGPLDPYAWLVGGTWRAALPNNAGSIEVRYDRVPDNAYAIRFATRFLSPKGQVTGTYVGNLYYDEAAKHAMIWYVDDEGAVVSGPMSYDDGTWRIALNVPGATVEVVRTANDSYDWTLYVARANAKKKALSLTYVRTAAAP